VGTDLIEDLAELKASVEKLKLLIAENQRQFTMQERKLQRYKAALEGLTPGGSEFVNDPENCARYVRDTMARLHKQLDVLTVEARALERGIK
jgi:hypothetical protein